MTVTSWDVDQIIDIIIVLQRQAGGAFWARDWLKTPNKELNGRRPCECLTSPVLYERMRQLVSRIDRGDEECA